MKNLAPDITRQRLLIEGTFPGTIDRDSVDSFLSGLAGHLGLRTYGNPTIHSTDGAGKPENQGFDAFIHLIDSGISFYVWSHKRFFAVLLFTCKKFDNEKALSITREFLNASEVATLEF
jgi:S-adenosylmethionine decarboxylase